MPSLRRRAIIAGALLAALLVALWVADLRRGKPRESNAVGDETRSAPPVAVPVQEESRSMAHLDPNLARPAVGTGEAYLDHAFRSFILAQHGQLGLSGSEVDRLVSDLLELYEVQTEVVGRFMQQTAADASSISVHVPPFPTEGKGVRDLLYERLRMDFPQQHERITAEIGAFVDDTFRGFGITDQTIVVKKTDRPDTFEVTWSAPVVAGQTPSRDPEGTTYGGSSGVMLLARDQIVSGEYRFLAPLVNRQFPADASGSR